jgi:type I restriction enzyme R subunit
LHQLKMARTLAVWLHRSTSADAHFKAGPFVPPPDPVHVEQELKEELDRARTELAVRQGELESVKLSATREGQLRQQAEAQAKSAYEHLAAAWSLAEESEARLLAERARFEQQLNAVQSAAAAAPAAQMACLLQNARSLNLSAASKTSNCPRSVLPWTC